MHSQVYFRCNLHKSSNKRFFRFASNGIEQQTCSMPWPHIDTAACLAVHLLAVVMFFFSCQPSSCHVVNRCRTSKLGDGASNKGTSLIIVQRITKSDTLQMLRVAQPYPWRRVYFQKSALLQLCLQHDPRPRQEIRLRSSSLQQCGAEIFSCIGHIYPVEPRGKPLFAK